MTKSNLVWNATVKLLDLLSALDIKSVWCEDEDVDKLPPFMLAMGYDSDDRNSEIRESQEGDVI